LMVVLGLWALYRYLLLTGRLDNGPAAQSRYVVELAAALFLVVQLNWIGIFYAFTIGLHYALTCWTRRQVQWKVLATLALPSLLSLGLNFYIMVWGMQHNITLESPSKDSKLFASSKQDTPWKLTTTLLRRAGRPERRSFSWTAWAKQNLEYAQANFTSPLLVFLGVYLLSLLAAPVPTVRRRFTIPAGAFVPTAPARVACPFHYLWFYSLPGLLFLVQGLSGSGITLRFSGPAGCHRGQEAGEAPRPAEGTSDKR
jgi:hypothetical protein